MSEGVVKARQTELLQRYRELARRRRDALFETLSQREEDAAQRQLLQRLQTALDMLRQIRPRAAEAVELRYFGRLGVPAIAKTIGRSEETGAVDLRFGRAWLVRALTK